MGRCAGDDGEAAGEDGDRPHVARMAGEGEALVAGGRVPDIYYVDNGLLLHW